jgi:hypothetical protein
VSGDCGSHPNNAIAKLMLAVVWGEACRYRPVVTPCSSIQAKARQ